MRPALLLAIALCAIAFVACRRDLDGGVPASYWAASSGPADTLTVPRSQTFVVRGVRFTMVGIQGGTFVMGASPAACDTAVGSPKPAIATWPRHRVTLSGFSLGRTPVTQRLWQAVMGYNPSYTPYYRDPDKPVCLVSWYDCQRFIAKLNALTRRHFHLPTEAQWEYAARGGRLSRHTAYAGSDSIGLVAWYDANSYLVGEGSAAYGTHPVGTKRPNELGLHDMSGNVWEWCADWFGRYCNGPQVNPTGPVSGRHRVIRGGGWTDSAPYLRVVCRDRVQPDERYGGLGFRLAL